MGGQLNSFHNVSDPTSVSYGNPELEPQYSNSFELNYLKSWTYHMISFSAYVRTADNMINRIAYMDNNVMYSTFANVSKMANSGCEIIFKNSLFRSKLDLTTTVNLYNNHISGWSYDFPTESGNIAHLSNEKQNSFAWDARLMANVKLPLGISFQATGRYASEQKEAQGARQGEDGAWTPDYAKSRATGLSPSIAAIYSTPANGRAPSTDPGYTQTSKRWRMGRVLGLTIKYSFGNMKSNKEGVATTPANPWEAPAMTKEWINPGHDVLRNTPID